MEPVSKTLHVLSSRLSSRSATQAIPGSSGKPEKTEPSTYPQRMAQIWSRMTEIYGHKWTSMYGLEPVLSWSAALADLTGEQLAAGFRWCAIDRSDPWPPSLPEFRHACLMANHGKELQGVMAYRAAMAYASAVQYGREIRATPAAVIEAVRQATALALISTSAEKSQSLFAYHYDQVLRAIRSGKTFAHDLPKAFPPQACDTSPAVVDEWCSKLKEILGGAWVAQRDRGVSGRNYETSQGEPK